MPCPRRIPSIMIVDRRASPGDHFTLDVPRSVSRKDRRMSATRLTAAFVVFAIGVPAAGRSPDLLGPAITDITTSGRIVVISDCLATSVTISARVVDGAGVRKVVLWFRAGSGRHFKSATMAETDGRFETVLKGTVLRGHGYGTLEFFITASDSHGNSTRSRSDRSIEFLPCVQA